MPEQRPMGVVEQHADLCRICARGPEPVVFSIRTQIVPSRAPAATCNFETRWPSAVTAAMAG